MADLEKSFFHILTMHQRHICMNDGELKEHFVDQETKNGFVYEIQDAIRCIQAGKLESDVVPWKDTLACAKLFDKINASCDEKALKTIEDIEAVPEETRAEL